MTQWPLQNSHMFPRKGEDLAVLHWPGNGFYVAAGFCGQGLMLGPGIALNLVSLITRGKPILSEEVFKSLSLGRDYSCQSEALK